MKMAKEAQKQVDSPGFSQTYIDLKLELKRDSDERLAHKKRLEEIMARTRGVKLTNSTPKKV